MKSSSSKPMPKYLKTLHSRYNRLPKVLWDLIWTYDNRYKVEFKKCVNELNIYFNRNRLIDRLNGIDDSILKVMKEDEKFKNMSDEDIMKYWGSK